MNDRSFMWNVFGYHRRFLAVLMVLLVLGCSSMDSKPDSAQPEGTQSAKRDWTCDDEADAAVERQDWEDARARHQVLLDRVPGNCLAIYHLGYILGKLGDRVEEAGHYERAVACGLDSDDLLFYNLGMAYGEMNFMEEALTAFEQAVRINPKNEENHFGLGLMAQTVGQTNRARTALLTAVDLNPHHWEAHIILVRIYLDQGQLTSARVHLDLLRENVPDNDEVVELWQTYQERTITTYGPPSK